MMLPLIILLHCYALIYASSESEPANSSEHEDNSAQKRSFENLSHEDMCETNWDIKEECKVCEMLSHPQGGSCCTDPDALLWCHLAIREVLSEPEDSREDEDSHGDSTEDEERQSNEDNEVEKRYGSLFSNWHWYSNRNDRRSEDNIAEAKRMEKRYGNLFGSLFTDRKLDKNKRYGIVFRHLFGRHGERDKRYGNLLGHLFSRYNDDKRDGSIRKRYGSLFGRLFSSKDKRYGSLSGPLFSESKTYGSLMGHRNGPKSDEDKRATEMEKRYGSLMGRPFSTKKLGRR